MSWHRAASDASDRMDEFRERQLNYDALDRLATCIETQTCGPGEQKVILFATDHFGECAESRLQQPWRTGLSGQVARTSGRGRR